jgi:hypothetical protein
MIAVVSGKESGTETELGNQVGLSSDRMRRREIVPRECIPCG